jgi:hypothetical protein
MESMRLILAVTAHEDWRVHHMNVKSAFLNGDLKELVYVWQPPGFAIGEEHEVLRWMKALYDLRQAPRACYSKLHTSLCALRFTHSDHEHAIYTWQTVSKPLVVGVYVDDLLIVGPVDADIAQFKHEMKEQFRYRAALILSED